MFSPLQDLLSIFFPSHCYSCGQPLVGDERYLCEECLLHLPTTHFAAVPNNITEQLFMGRFPFQAATSLLYYKEGGEAQSSSTTSNTTRKSDSANNWGDSWAKSWQHRGDSTMWICLFPYRCIP